MQIGFPESVWQKRVIKIC